MVDTRITVKYGFIVLVAVMGTWLIHEFAHWLVYYGYGYDAVMTLNRVSIAAGQNPSEQQQIIAAAAGPLITLMQAVLVYGLLKFRKWNKYLYPFLFSAFYMRLVAGFMNVIKPNDEGRISLFLNLGTFTIPLVVSGLLFYLVFSVAKQYQLTWQFQTVTTIMVMALSSVVILSDQFFSIRLI